MTHTLKKGTTGKTRGGHSYEVVADDLGDAYPIAAVVYDGFTKVLERYARSGCFLVGGETHPNDLMPPAPTVVSELWANVYPDYVGAWYETRLVDHERIYPNRIGVLRRTLWSDGTRTYEEETL